MRAEACPKWSSVSVHGNSTPCHQLWCAQTTPPAPLPLAPGGNPPEGNHLEVDPVGVATSGVTNGTGQEFSPEGEKVGLSSEGVAHCGVLPLAGMGGAGRETPFEGA